MNNTVIALAIGIIIIVFGFLIYSTMNDKPDTVPVVNVNNTTNNTETAQTEAQKEAAFQAQRKENEAKEVAFTIDVTKLPEAPQVALKTMGVNETSIKITNAMVTCAGADLSEARMAEIKGGASVSIVEGIKLVGCYNAN